MEYRAEDLKRLIRLDVSKAELTAMTGDMAPAADGKAAVTMADLRAALEGMRRLDLSGMDAWIWYKSLKEKYRENLEPALLFDEGRSLRYPADFPDSEAGNVCAVWDILDEMDLDPDVWDDESSAADLESVRDAGDYIGCWFHNQGKPKTDWNYPELMQALFLTRKKREGSSGDSEADQARLVKAAEELAREEDPLAYQVRSQEKLAGDGAYPMDPAGARDDAEKLYDQTGDPEAANTLGKIFYSGEGLDEPDYSKAFAFFVYSAANGSAEGRLMLADMYRRGRGVSRSPRTAWNILEKLFSEEIGLFWFGSPLSHIAETGCRLAELALYEESLKQPDEAAVYYLLAARADAEAREAGGLRDENLIYELRDLEKDAALLVPKEDGRTVKEAGFARLDRLFEDGYQVAWEAGKISVVFRRIPKPDEKEASKVLLIEPAHWFIGELDRLDLVLTGEIPENGEADCLTLGKSGDEEGSRMVRLWRDGKIAAEFPEEGIDWILPENPEAEEENSSLGLV